MYQSTLDTVTNTDITNYKTLEGNSVVDRRSFNTVAEGEATYRGMNINELTDELISRYEDIASEDVDSLSDRDRIPFDVIS